MICQFSRYFIIGFINTLLHWGLFISLVYIVSLSQALANSVLLCYCALFFIPSYLLFTYMMLANIQHEIREEIILQGKEQ